MIGTVDLAVMGLSILCAVGSTLTYLWFRWKHPEHSPRTSDTNGEHNSPVVQAREQSEQSEVSVQRAQKEQDAVMAQASEQIEQSESKVHRVLPERDDAIEQVREQVEQGQTNVRRALERYRADRKQVMQQYEEAVANLMRTNIGSFVAREVRPGDRWAQMVITSDAPFVDNSSVLGALGAFDRREHQEDLVVEFGIPPTGMGHDIFVDPTGLPEGHYILYSGKGVWLVQNQWGEEDAANFRQYLGSVFKEGGMRLRDKELA